MLKLTGTLSRQVPSNHKISIVGKIASLPSIVPFNMRRMKLTMKTLRTVTKPRNSITILVR